MNPAECLLSVRNNLPDIVRYSGRYLFRLGKYHQCLETESLDYFFIQAGQKGTPDQSLFLGVCLPKVCSNKTVESLVNAVLDIGKLPLQAKSVVNHIGDYQYPYTMSFFVTFTIIIVLTTLVLISSISSSASTPKLLKSFSIQSTTSSLQTYIPGGRLNILNGLKSLSMFWVIYGHTMSAYVGYSENILSVEKNVLSDWRFLTVEAGLYSVDCFFFIGGFLLAYGVMREGIGSKVGYLLVILNRLLRLLPAYFIAIMIYYSIFPHLGSGPFWQNQLSMSQLCHSLWRPLLFVDNLIDNGNNMCMGWGWYLQNDIQLFFYCLLILVVYQRNKFWGIFMIFLSMFANFWYVMEETYGNREKWLTHISDAAASQRYQLDIYYKPWGRCPPYLYGLLLGLLYCQFLAYQSKLKNQHSNSIQSQSQSQQLSLQYQHQSREQENEIPQKPILYKVKQKFQQKVWLRRGIELLGVFLCLFISFIPRTNQGDRYWPQFVHSIYLTYGKIAFVFSLSLTILPSLILNPETSKNPPKLLTRFLLDTKTFNFLAKVSFCTYLIHLTFLLTFFGNTKIDFYYSLYPVFVIFVSFSVFSVFGGTLLVYIVEGPFAKIQKIVVKALMDRNHQRRNSRMRKVDQAREHNEDKKDKKEGQGQIKEKNDGEENLGSSAKIKDLRQCDGKLKLNESIEDNSNQMKMREEK